MTDLVTNLRVRAAQPFDDGDVFDDLDRFIMEEAADEIQRLRACEERLLAWVSRLIDKMAKQPGPIMTDAMTDAREKAKK